MGAIPPAIIIVNADISTSVRETLVRQLFINEVLDGYVFDAYVEENTNYVANIKQLNQRIMIVRTFIGRGDVATWTLADVVIYVKRGLAYLMVNKFGPFGLALPVVKLYWGSMGVY